MTRDSPDTRQRRTVEPAQATRPTSSPVNGDLSVAAVGSDAGVDAGTLSKITGLEGLARLAAAKQGAGYSVVLAHGCFDLLHLGHLRHLQQARELGDCLFVTVTADRFVNKGPGRPAFSAAQRAEMLAGLECVDGVAINQADSAVPAISAIRPDVYVKGPDYSVAEDDSSGRIKLETEEVTKWGGRFVTTSGETYSSTRLLQTWAGSATLGRRSAEVRLPGSPGIADVGEVLDRIAGLSVLLVGEAIIDEYVTVETMGRSPKQELVAHRQIGTETFAGGVVPVANTLAQFCGDVSVVSLVGDDTAARLIEDAFDPRVRVTLIPRDGAPTIRKTRFRRPPGNTLAFQLQRVSLEPLLPDEQEAVQAAIRARGENAGLCMALDYGHGLISDAGVRQMRALPCNLAASAQTNSANLGQNLITRYRGSDYACVNRAEASLAVPNTEIAGVARTLSVDLGCRALFITLGAEGCIGVAGAGGTQQNLPSLTQETTDTLGASDQFFALMAPALECGASLTLAGTIASAAGALATHRQGHGTPIDRQELERFLEPVLGKEA